MAGSTPGALGFTKGSVVQEFYYDDDVDMDLRASIETDTGQELVDEDYGDVADGAIIWWRLQDGDVEDLTDLIVDASGNLEDGGIVWVLSPKTSSPDYVEPAEIAEAAKTAGLHATSTISAAASWQGTKLTTRARGR
ncbi:MAG: DUF3052 domain-containing protein [Actinomycetaceae bacterium]|nr:DUF3052 domain-containing protein [Actinomycetaceae bacterium]